jgi:hypothetical protein
MLLQHRMLRWVLPNSVSARDTVECRGHDLSALVAFAEPNPEPHAIHARLPEIAEVEAEASE